MNCPMCGGPLSYSRGHFRCELCGYIHKCVIWIYEAEENRIRPYNMDMARYVATQRMIANPKWVFRGIPVRLFVPWNGDYVMIDDEMVSAEEFCERLGLEVIDDAEV